MSLKPFENCAEWLTSGRRFFLFLGALLLVSIIVLVNISGPLFQVGFGVPTPNGKQVSYTDTASDSTKTVQVGGASFEWSFLKKTYTVREEEPIALAEPIVLTLALDANLIVKVEVTPAGGPTEITEKVVIFKVAEDPARNVTVFRRSEYHVFSYSFKINTAFAGTVNIREVSYTRGPCVIVCIGPSKEDMGERAVKKLLAQVNTDVYEKATKLTWDLNAPALTTGQIVPGYVGLMGLFLQDYKTEGFHPGTGADLSPQQVGTPVNIYLDQALTKQAFALQTPTPINWTGPTDLIYYPDHFATPYAYWQTGINTLGSTLSFQRAGRESAYPNWWAWAYQANPCVQSCTLPAVAQWFRVDILELTSMPFEIPNFNIPEDQRAKQSINVPGEPVNRGTTTPPPASIADEVRIFLNKLWDLAKWIIIGAFILLILIAVFVVVRKI